ncbi:MAG: lysophospholipid acyltransferase family protein [Terracidiphilus sp.]|nr:lysophospholipid acyltransferase family protein [Terracidiphilus sp.]
MLASLSILVTIIVLSLPAAVVFIPWTVLTGDATMLYNISQKIVRTAFRVGRIRIIVEGREHIPAGRACIFMANHVSNLDPPSLLPQIPGRTSVFLKRSLMKIPILGYAFKLGEFVPVDRGGRMEAAIESVRAAQVVLEKGLHITTFVEGTRSQDGRMLPFKKGPFYLAMQTGAPCIPVSIYGSETLMAKGSMRITPGTVHITFHEPIDPGKFASRAELMSATRAAIANGLPEWMRN